jgi:hypothetical protein
MVKPKLMPDTPYDTRPAVAVLLKKIVKALPALMAIQKKYQDHWGEEDRIYRYYHGSFKVFYLQEHTVEIVKALRKLHPSKSKKRKLNAKFKEIVKDGTGKVFKIEMNQTWSVTVRPIMEAYFHARYFLDMTIKYGEEFKGERPPNFLPSGWASVLYLYGLR